MDSPVSRGLWARADSVSSVTVGLFSWLEDVARMWRARQLGAYRWVPSFLITSLYLWAALFAGISSVCDVVALTVRDRVREFMDDRRATRQLQHVLATTAVSRAARPSDEWSA